MDDVSKNSRLNSTGAKSTIVDFAPPALSFFALAAFILLDQISKYLSLKYFASISTINTGGGFNVGQGFDGFKIINLFLVLGITYIFVIYGRRPKMYPLVPVLAGSISNLIDRFVRGGVVDFINIKIWPSFNLADSFITIGLIWLVVAAFAVRPKKQ